MSEQDIEALEKKLLKDYGAEIMLSGDQIRNKTQKVISISPELDCATNGGVPEGSWLNILGPPKVGKTVTALTVAANGQKIGKTVCYSNIEHRLKARDLHGIEGLILDRPYFKMFQSTQDFILSAEQHLDIAEEYLMNSSDVIWIIDSVSALMTEKEKISKLSEQQRADGAKLMAKFCRRMESVVPLRRHIIISICHMIANPSGMGSPFQETGGNKINFQSDVKLRARKSEAWENTAKQQIGQKIDWHVIWSALGSPGAKVSGYLRYGRGLDREWETIQMAKTAEIVTLKGAWYLYKDHKAQGEEKFHRFLMDNPLIYQELQKEVSESYGLPLNAS